ncbi:MAG: hypothetical protein K2X87_02770 [Gemmataceae bacterium]|nr:hypothetical protein [Gemmataceae bacterium]
MRRLPLLVVLLAAGPAAAADYPQVQLKNDALTLTVYLPDAEKGFYRGTRFDHAGVFGEVRFAGHKLFGPWKGEHDPANNDDIVGPCEEFGMGEPLGWAEAEPGGTFLKIGVGELEKPKDAKEYQFWGKYKIVKPPAWAERRRESTAGAVRSIGWDMSAKLPAGYGYHYRKDLDLDPKDPIVTIKHRLTNTGTKPLATTVYNHNFFNVDGDPVGPNYAIRFGFAPKAPDPKERFAEVVKLDGNELRLAKSLSEGSIWSVLTGFGDGTDRAFSMRHAPTGVRVDVSHDKPFDRFVVWGVGSCLCPEPFQTIKLAPGESAEWSIAYRFAVEKK